MHKIKQLFKHNCFFNKKIIKSSFLKDDDSNVVFDTGKEYKCQKCGLKWFEV